MKIAVAQTKALKGNMAANIENHKKVIGIAAKYNANAIFFPELSITGYEPELAKDLATDFNDERFDEFQQISNDTNIVIGIGVPTTSEQGVRITMLVFHPDVERLAYSKQQLHEDELPYFVTGHKQLILTIGETKIAPAICYESLQTNHSEDAVSLGAEIYIASVAKSQNGVNKAMIHYPAVAQRFSIPVLMSNCVGFCDNFESVGSTAVWNKEGKLIDQLDKYSEGIIIYDTETDEVTNHISFRE